MNKEDLLNILRICNADQTAIDAVEMGYEAGMAAGAMSAATLVESMGAEGYGTLAIAVALRQLGETK